MSNKSDAIIDALEPVKARGRKLIIRRLDKIETTVPCKDTQS